MDRDLPPLLPPKFCDDPVILGSPQKRPQETLSARLGIDSTSWGAIKDNGKNALTDYRTAQKKLPGSPQKPSTTTFLATTGLGKH
jgi:hypothetical protein